MIIFNNDYQFIILFSMYYTYNGSIAEQPDGKNWNGLNRFIFHVVEM